jgi:hypothetical protein
MPAVVIEGAKNEVIKRDLLAVPIPVNPAAKLKWYRSSFTSHLFGGYIS